MDKHYGFIYLTIDLKNGKGYVGQHKIRNQKTLDPEYIGSGKRIKYILKSNGNDKSRFHRQILCFCEYKEELDEKEKEYIDFFDAIESENFYNYAEGGEGGDTMAGFNEEQKEEFSKKMSEVTSGENNGMYGKHHKEESIKKMSEVKKGEKNPMYGQHRSEEFVKKVSGEKNYLAKSIYSPELNTVFTYMKLVEKYCVDILNVSVVSSNIVYVCKGYRKYSGKLQDGTKLTWKYATDVDQETLDKAEYIDSKKYEEILSQNVNVCNK